MNSFSALLFAIVVVIGANAAPAFAQSEWGDALESAYQAHDEGRHAEEAYWYERAWPALERDLQSLPGLRARNRINFALALREAQRADEALTQAQRAWSELNGLQGARGGQGRFEYAEDLVRAAFVIAKAGEDLGDSAGAERAFISGLEAARAHGLGYGNALVVLVHAELANLQARLGRFSDARATIEPVAAPTSAARCTPIWGPLLELLADIQQELGDRAGADATWGRLTADIVHSGCTRAGR